MLEQRISLVTLGVDDPARARAFYAAMGWRETPVAAEGIAFLQLLGQGLALYPRADLARDIGRPAGPSGAVTLAQNTRTPEEVDALHARAVAAGAESLSRPAATAWGGCVAHVADPDGHVWDFAHVPMFALSEDGALSPGAPA
jgi:predicted lactoylglutathione lyase